MNGPYASSRENATPTAGLSASGPKVKAISATTKGARRFIAGGVLTNKVASQSNAKTDQARRVGDMKVHSWFGGNPTHHAEVKLKCRLDVSGQTKSTALIS